MAPPSTSGGSGGSGSDRTASSTSERSGRARPARTASSTGKRSATRQRIVDASADLLRRQGYDATGIKEIVAAAQAPFGSIYHFFPGGKEELGAAAIRQSGAAYGKLIPAILGQAPDLVSGVRAFFALAAEDLTASGYADACPIATVALEISNRSEVMRSACAAVFEDWIDAGTAIVAGHGIPDADARRLVIELVTLLEGAFVLCRATRQTEALEVVGDAAVASAAAALRRAQATEVTAAKRHRPKAARPERS